MSEPIMLLSHDALDELVDVDPIKLRDEAFKMRAEVERLNEAVQVLGTALQADSMKVVDELKAHADAASLPIEDVERFLKWERDEHAKGSLAWRDLDDVLEAFRLHMVTGTPLTSPRPEEDPTDPSVGSPPLTEAEELRIDVDRLTSERDKASEAAKHMGAALEKAGTLMQIAVATSLEFGNAAAMDVIISYLSDAGLLPSPPSDGEIHARVEAAHAVSQPVPDGGETP